MTGWARKVRMPPSESFARFGELTMHFPLACSAGQSGFGGYSRRFEVGISSSNGHESGEDRPQEMASDGT